MPWQPSSMRRNSWPLLCLLMTLSTTSCGGISLGSQSARAEAAASDPVVNAKAACPTPLYPTVAAWKYRDSLPVETDAQKQFRDWTGRIVQQQTELAP